MTDNPIQDLATWIESLSKESIEVGLDTDIIEQRLVSSLQLIQLIIRIEGQTGQQIDVDNIDVDNFRTLRRIEQYFFAKVPVPAESTA